jgi:hypothetical protein
MRLQFSGHDSFICKNLWLKKGFDYLSTNGSFTDELAVVHLGVGKNMVTSINYWLRAFGLFDNNNKLTDLSKFIFDSKKGVDPYVESLGTVWLLHYSLVKTGKASIYHLFFNEFRKGRFEFTKEQLFNFIRRKIEMEANWSFTSNTISSDIGVFIRNYLKPDYKGSKIDVEDDFASLMIDLDLMETYQSDNAEGKSVEWYRVENKQRIDLPFQIVLFSILDNENYGNSISFKELLSGMNAPGSVFAITDEGLYQKVEQITAKYKDIIYTESAGVRELQFKKKPNKWDVLHEYYKD